jgi:hypothetical protein
VEPGVAPYYRPNRSLADHRVEARIAPSFGAEELPRGLVAVTGRRPA